MATVLVVDDHARVNESICRVLRAEGHQTVSAACGKDALARLATDLPDVVILDVSMPGMSGIEVLRLIRSDPQTATLPVIIFSAVSDPAIKQHALDLDANEYLVKGDANPALLGQIIAKLVPTRTPA